MKIPSLRTIHISAIVLLAVSVAIQLFILHRIYVDEEKQFHLHVAKSLQVLFEKNILIGTGAEPFTKMKLASNSFVIPLDSIHDENRAMNMLSKEFSDYRLPRRFMFFVSSGNESSYSRKFEVTSNDYSVTKNQFIDAASRPLVAGPHLYLEFPGKNIFLLKKITPWILSYLLLIVLLTAIAFVLYNFYKNRFWNGIQKEFVNNFIHEFRTPLSVITIGARVLQSQGIENDSTRFKKYTGIIKEQTDHLEQKVSQIIALSLSGKKSTYLKKEMLDVNALVANAISFLEPVTEEKKATIEFISGENVKSIGDSRYLTQCIVNLLDNSLKYANLPHIRLETFVSEKKSCILIRDNGIGMEKKYFKHIFRKYYRIPTGDVHNVKGFGIGLNFVKNVIDAHNGRIEVSSTPGKGTEFRIKLPLI